MRKPTPLYTIWKAEQVDLGSSAFERLAGGEPVSVSEGSDVGTGGSALAQRRPTEQADWDIDAAGASDTSSQFEPLHSEVTALWATASGLRQKLSSAESKIGELEQNQEWRESGEELYISYAGGSELGLFILQMASQVDSLPIAEAADNLATGDGWIAVARLLKAGLLDENGKSLYLTTAGEKFLADV